MLAESLYADPVVAELHEVRRRLLEASGGDVAEFRRRLRDRQKASSRKIVSGPVKKHTEPRDAMGSRAASLLTSSACGREPLIGAVRRSGMKKATRWILGVIGAMVAVPLVGFALLVLSLLLSRFGLMAQKIDVVGGERCWNVPDTARNIYAKGSHLHFAAEFEITEKELVEYCQMRGWSLAEIATPVSARTYRAYGDSNAEEGEITVAQGLVHDSMTHRGGFKVVFDRAAGKAFLEFSHN